MNRTDFRGQALAAIGQCRLISLWDNLFGHLRQPIAQILLTRNDIADVCFPPIELEHWLI
jgi:glutamate 5-kinase